MLERKILHSIPHAIRTIRSVSADSLEKSLTFQQYRILALVHRGMGQSEMARALQISNAAISKMVDPLIKKKLLLSTPAEDRRFKTLKLSRTGESLRVSVSQKVDSIFSVHINKLSTKEQNDLLKGLDVLDKLMGFVNEN